MFRNILFILICATTIATVNAACAAHLGRKQKAELLAAQNEYRREVGEPSLRWSDKLAQSAQAWANHLANDVHAMVHSDAIAIGENLATWPAGHATLTRLVQLWGDEKKYFVDASFPGISSTGDWKVAGHYSQLIWRNTTEVGCGLATGGGQDYLVCQYSPKGNMADEKAY